MASKLLVYVSALVAVAYCLPAANAPEKELDCTENAPAAAGLHMVLINPTKLKVKVRTCDETMCQGNPLKPAYYRPCGSANDRVEGLTNRSIHFNANVTYIVFSNGVGVKEFHKPTEGGWPVEHRINIPYSGSDVVAELAAAQTQNVSIYKVDYPEKGACGQEANVEKSNLNPHYFFPVHFGGFKVGECRDAGYSRFEMNVTVAMHPFPGVHHNLTFEIWGK